MDPQIIGLLVVLVGLATLNYHLGFRRLTEPLDHYAQAAFVLLTFVLIPVVVLVLYQQAGATDRLAATGVVPHPELGNAVGVAAGTGDEAVWLFETRASSQTIIAFYREEAHRSGWELVTDSGMIILHRADESMAIISSDDPGRVSYMLKSASPSTRGR